MASAYLLPLDRSCPESELYFTNPDSLTIAPSNGVIPAAPRTVLVFWGVQRLPRSWGISRWCRVPAVSLGHIQPTRCFRSGAQHCWALSPLPCLGTLAAPAMTQPAPCSPSMVFPSSLPVYWCKKAAVPVTASMRLAGLWLPLPRCAEPGRMLRSRSRQLLGAAGFVPALPEGFSKGLC